jgi:hypothetical protein
MTGYNTFGAIIRQGGLICLMRSMDSPTADTPQLSINT